MPTECYACHSGTGIIPGTSATNVLGSCKICCILTCSRHAQRDPHYPRWICVLCDPTLLTGAAIATSENLANESILASLISSAIVQEGARYRSVEVFLEQRPAYREVVTDVEGVVESAPRIFTTNETEPFWFGLSREGQRLVAAAIILVQNLKIPEHALVEALRILMRVWRSRQR